MMRQYPTPVVQSNGSPSSTPSYPMLCSITPPWAGGYVGDVKTTPGWSEARPTGGLDNMTQPSHLYYGSTSRSPNQLLLSSCPQYGMGLPGDMFQSQPPPSCSTTSISTITRWKASLLLSLLAVWLGLHNHPSVKTLT